MRNGVPEKLLELFLEYIQKHGPKEWQIKALTQDGLELKIGEDCDVVLNLSILGREVTNFQGDYKKAFQKCVSDIQQALKALNIEPARMTRNAVAEKILPVIRHIGSVRGLHVPYDKLNDQSSIFYVIDAQGTVMGLTTELMIALNIDNVFVQQHAYQNLRRLLHQGDWKMVETHDYHPLKGKLYGWYIEDREMIHYISSCSLLKEVWEKAEEILNSNVIGIIPLNNVFFATKDTPNNRDVMAIMARNMSRSSAGKFSSSSVWVMRDGKLVDIN